MQASPNVESQHRDPRPHIEILGLHASTPNYPKHISAQRTKFWIRTNVSLDCIAPKHIPTHSTENFYPGTSMAVEATFQRMGLQSKGAVVFHLLLENAYESNLVADISQVDFLAEHLGLTNFHLLEGLPAFVDDVYIFGYLWHKECVHTHGTRRTRLCQGYCC